MTNPHVAAVKLAFSMFQAAYNNKWSGAAPEVWSALLEDATAEEIVKAAKDWCRGEEWPPTPKDILQSIPRFCRCGKCWPCQIRAMDRARMAVERGALDAALTLPERVTRADALPERPALPSHE